MNKQIKVDYNSPVPIYEQIKQAIKLQIINKLYITDEKIISIRELASNLKVNQNTILKAYYQLDVEGYIYSKPGQGYFVKKIETVDLKENKKILNYLTNEFLNKALSLGFTLKEIINEIEKGGN